MKKKSRFIAVCAMLAALSVAILYIASVSPTGRLGIVAASSLLGIAAVIEATVKGGCAVYVVTALLGFLIVPEKSAPLLYPIIKSIAENRQSRALEWLIKLLSANAALTAILLLFSGLVKDFLGLDWGMLPIYAVFNVCFVIFDIGVSKVIGLYLARISKHIK